MAKKDDQGSRLLLTRNSDAAGARLTDPAQLRCDSCIAGKQNYHSQRLGVDAAGR